MVTRESLFPQPKAQDGTEKLKNPEAYASMFLAIEGIVLCHLEIQECPKEDTESLDALRDAMMSKVALFNSLVDFVPGFKLPTYYGFRKEE